MKTRVEYQSADNDSVAMSIPHIEIVVESVRGDIFYWEFLRQFYWIEQDGNADDLKWTLGHHTVSNYYKYMYKAKWDLW